LLAASTASFILLATLTVHVNEIIHLPDYSTLCLKCTSNSSEWYFNKKPSCR